MPFPCLKLLVKPSGSLFFGNGSFSFFLHCHGYYKSSETSKVRTRKDMFHFIQLYVRFGGLGAEGLKEKNGFDDVIKLLVYARGE